MTSAPSRSRPATGPAGSSSIPMPSSPPPTSRSGPSRSSRGGCSTCRAGRCGASRSRSRAWARSSPAPTDRRAEGPYFLRDQPTDLPAWPRPATTDADGRFTIRGVGRGLRVGLAIDDPRFARLRIDVDTDGSSATKDLTMAVEPARIITGRVTYADTGEPAPHARVEHGDQPRRGARPGPATSRPTPRGASAPIPGSATIATASRSSLPRRRPT